MTNKGPIKPKYNIDQTSSSREKSSRFLDAFSVVTCDFHCLGKLPKVFSI